jgi:WD40 repeat protein
MDSSGRFIALGMGDGTMRILDARTGLPLAPQLPTASLRFNNVSISPDGRYIATSGFPPSVNIWDSRTFTPVGLPLPIDVTQGGSRARFGPDGRLWVLTGPVLQVFTVDPDQWLARACHEAGRTLTKGEYQEILPDRPYQPACA